MIPLLANCSCLGMSGRKNYPKEKHIHLNNLQRKKEGWYFHQHDKTLLNVIIEHCLKHEEIIKI